MHALLLKKTLKQTKSGSALNLPTTESSCKRVYGLWKVFGDCRTESDWKKPQNAARTWKGKVKWHLMKHYDTTALAEDSHTFAPLEEEVAGKLQARAFVQRNLSLADSLSANLTDGLTPDGSASDGSAPPGTI